MQWWRRLLRIGDRSGLQASGPDAKSAAAPQRSSFAIPVPEGANPDWYERVPQAKKRGRRRTPEEIEEDHIEFVRATLVKNTARAEFERDRLLKIGCTEFIWRTARDAGVCEACAALADQRFRYDLPPAVGLPGTHECANGICRCYAEAVIPD